MKSSIIYARSAVAVGAALLIISCAPNDVVVSAGLTSLGKLLPLLRVDSTETGFQAEAPGGERFRVAADFSNSGDDLSIAVDAAPFLEAGLDPPKLTGPERVEGDRLVIRTDAGSAWKGGRAADFLKAVELLTQNYRSLIAYHDELDHYLIMVGGGHTWEWAANRKTNAADIVFVLNPEVLAAAGLDANRVAGWALKDVTVRDASGRRLVVKRLIRAYDLD